MVTTSLSTIPTLAADIRNAHADCLAALSSALDHARLAGEKLAEAKAAIAHGGFQDFVEENCGISARTARTYLQIHRGWATIEEAKRSERTVLTIENARALLAKPKPKPEPDDNDEEWKNDPELERIAVDLDRLKLTVVPGLRELGGVLAEARDIFGRNGVEYRFWDWCQQVCELERSAVEDALIAADPAVPDSEIADRYWRSLDLEAV